MSLWKIAWRSIQQRSLASMLTALSMALGVALVVCVLVIGQVVEKSFRSGNALGYNVIAGAKGGRLDLMLNTVYYLNRPIENIPWAYYKEFLPAADRKDGQAGRFSANVDIAVPVCLGDVLGESGEFRVVGTTPDLFTKLLNSEFESGRNFKPDEFFEGVLGSVVAREMNLKVGQKFFPTHGAAGGHVHDPFTVVGILKRTGTPNDRAAFVNMEGFFLLEGHDKGEDASGHESAVRGQGSAAKSAPAEKDADHDHKADHAKDDHDHKAEGGQKADHDHKDSEKADHDHKDADHKEADAKDHDHEKADHDHKATDGQKADHDHKEADHKDSAHKNADHKDADHKDHDHDAGHKGHAHDHGDHAHEHHEPLPEERREVTAVLIRSAGIGGGMLPELTAPHLVKDINKDFVAQAIEPIKEINVLNNTFVRPVQLTLLVLTVLIVVVAGVGIMVSIYNSMSERRHEIAVMRALGAHRGRIMMIVLAESILLALGGGLLGWIAGHALVGAAAPLITDYTGVAVGFLQFAPRFELILIPSLIALAAVVGYLPALSAYRTDVARALTATP